MTPPIDQLYFDWLCSQIKFPRNFNATFNELLVRLHETEFHWIIPGDDNRIHDAEDMRVMFTQNGLKIHYFKPYISVLEIIISVSQRLEFVASGQAPEWAWRLIDNLQLNHYYDPLNNDKMLEIDDILDRLIWRTYERNGRGGFFPLLFPKEDQTRVEIWYQLNAYALEIVQEA
jgi:hypothetical protein